MKKFDFLEICEALDKLNLQTSEIVLTHSSLMHLGYYQDENYPDVCYALEESFRRIIGDKGTIVVPTFNFGFCRGETFDIDHTRSDKMGVFSEYIRNHPEAIRSKHPMQSIAALGGFSADICEPDTYSCFAVNGPISKMIDAKAKLVLIGASFQAASLIHFVEERLNVPYRYFKKFSGLYVNEKARVHETREYSMFVRDSAANPILKLEILENEMASRGLLHTVKLGGGKAVSCTFEDFITVATEMITNNPYCLLENPQTVENIIGTRGEL